MLFIFSLQNPWRNAAQFFVAKFVLFDAFWGPGPPACAMASQLCEFLFFLRVLMSKLVFFGLLANFGVLRPPWATILRVWGYPWTDLARSRCQRPPPPFTPAPFLAILEPKWEPERCQNGAKILKKTVQNPIKKSMRFWIAFVMDFSACLVPKLIEIWMKMKTHRRIKAKRPRAAKYCKYQYKLNVFWISGVALWMNFG